MNMYDSEVFPSVVTLQAKGQLAVQLGKELPLGKQKLLLLLISPIKLESFHLLQVSNTICCLKGRWHWSSAAPRACLINQAQHQRIWNVSVIATIPFFFLFQALNIFWLDLHDEVNYFFARGSRNPVSSTWLSGPHHSTSIFIPSHGAVSFQHQHKFQAVSVSRKLGPKNRLKNVFIGESHGPPGVWGAQSKSFFLLKIKILTFCWLTLLPAGQNKHSNQGFFCCFLIERDTNLCPRKNNRALEFITHLNWRAHHYCS